MPVYSYRCPEHGEFDTFSRVMRPEASLPCTVCGVASPNRIAAPGILAIKRDWNEKANDWQRNPYDQAKAQLTNINRERAEAGKSTVKVTEAMVQAGAKQIDKEKRHPSSGAVVKKAHQLQKKAAAEKKRTAPV